MLYHERHSKILEYLAVNGSAAYKELSELLGVSEATVRRDLTAMENAKELDRFWGGAKKRPDRPGRHRSTIEGMITENKRIIGEIAAKFIRDNELIFIGSGMTTLAMIHSIECMNITVITNGIPQLEALKKKNIKAFLLCGFLKEYSRAVVGRQTVDMLSQYKFDKAFLGVNGLDSTLSLLSADEYENDIKRVSIQNSNDSYVLADHTKFNCSAMYQIPLCEIDHISIITDKKMIENTDCTEILKGYVYKMKAVQ